MEPPFPGTFISGPRCWVNICGATPLLCLRQASNQLLVLMCTCFACSGLAPSCMPVGSLVMPAAGSQVLTCCWLSPHQARPFAGGSGYATWNSVSEVVLCARRLCARALVSPQATPVRGLCPLNNPPSNVRILDPRVHKILTCEDSFGLRPHLIGMHPATH